MHELHIGLVGVGIIGKKHIKNFADQAILGARITAVCDRNADHRSWAYDMLSGRVSLFDDFTAMLSSDIDAVLIAAPHYFHPEMVIAALHHDKHILVEKPVGVYTKNVIKMNDYARESDRVFSILFPQRVSPIYLEVKKYIDEKRLGTIHRIHYTATDWYRQQFYYDQADWRGTYGGEGGGVLLNQAPHQLDLLQWIFGMPQKVYAKCISGKYHSIEVEDEVHALFEYDDSLLCTFIASTGEYPGENKLEIYGDRGRIIASDTTLILEEFTDAISLVTFDSRLDPGINEAMSHPLKIDTMPNCQVALTQNFIDAILYGDKLIAEGTDGIRSLELSNACYLSSWHDTCVDIPVDADLFYRELQKRM